MADATAKLAKAEIRGGARVATKAGGAAKGAAAAAAEGEDYAPTGLDDRFQSTGREGNSQLILCVRAAAHTPAAPRGRAPPALLPARAGRPRLALLPCPPSGALPQAAP